MKIAIAGAAGFVGRALAAQLSARHQVVALTRRAPSGPQTSAIEWRTCDLFSALETERALEGCDAAVYLVHSMLPSARLTQASFADLDLILADNFARGAARAGLKRIVYLGGIIPDDPELSAHLTSRREVEETFRAAATPLVGLRAGLVIGPGGSSFRIIDQLVRRLPLMALPAWTRTPTQPIALEDVTAILERCLDAPGIEGQSFDIAGPDITDYAGLLSGTARALGLRRRTFPVRWFSPGLSTLWVSLITGAPRELVAPLVQSLRHRMVAGDRRLQEQLGVPGLGLEAALHAALAPQPPPAPAAALVPATPQPARSLTLAARSAGPEHDVRSVQRLPLPAGWSAAQVASEYQRWLPRFFRPLLRVEAGADGSCRFLVRGLRAPLLVLRLSDERSSPERQLFYVTGGLLAETGGPRRGRLEFREVLGGAAVLAGIHDFTPTLPWWIYQATQALVHLLVMRSFGRHLGRLRESVSLQTS